MKRFKAILLCGTLVFSSALCAGTPLQVKASAKVDLKNVSFYSWEKHPWGYEVRYVAYTQKSYNALFLEKQPNQKKRQPKYGPVTAYSYTYTDPQTQKERILKFVRLDEIDEYTGECVSFVKAVTINPKGTEKWTPGVKITEETKKWTVIANFKGFHRYPQPKYGEPAGHVAILYQAYKDGTALVFDQNYDHRNPNADNPNYSLPGLLTLRKITAKERNTYHTVEQ